jgi:ATP-dependent phosphofructokinase / diphosphate-dependent phosphofructokinase
MPTDLIQGAAVIGQSGGPTAVINQSLVGAVLALQGHQAITNIYGARNGVRGMIENRYVDLTNSPPDFLEAIAQTPSAALGSTRDKPDEAYCERIFESLRARDVRYFFYIGGNDSSDTCRIVNDLSDQAGYELRCFHIPKTIDNDLMENDHTPGYPSAARYVANAFTGDNLDNKSLPGIKIDIVMGRHAGFLAAASAMARRFENDGPHLIYLPERDFDPDRFVADVEGVYSKLGRCLIAVSEGIHNADGEAISYVLSQTGEVDAHGNVQLSGSGALGDFLANLLRQKLTPQGGTPPRIRADTLGYMQRCYPDPSPVDQREARAAGARAAELAMSGDLDGSIAIKRGGDEPYRSEPVAVKLTAVAGKTRVMPDEFLAGDNNVSDEFIRYLRPLVGELPVVEEFA